MVKKQVYRALTPGEIMIVPIAGVCVLAWLHDADWFGRNLAWIGTGLIAFYFGLKSSLQK